MTSPYSPPPVTALNPANSRHRSETYGIRPDLHHQLEENSVSKQDVDNIAEEFEGGQAGLEGRLDLIEGVPGYVCAYMGNNINASWDFFGNSERMMPFNRQIGPAQNGGVSSNGRVYLNAKGLWTLYVRIHARNTGYAGNGGVRMTVRVRNPNGSLHHEAITYGTTLIEAGALTADKGRGTISATFPVVIQHPGSYVEVHAWTATWRWWDGGMRYSTLAALRHSEDVVNIGQDTVPDEGRQ